MALINGMHASSWGGRIDFRKRFGSKSNVCTLRRGSFDNFRIVTFMTEAHINELVQLALDTFEDGSHEDNLTYAWLHGNWSATRDRPRPKAWGKQIKRLRNDVLTALAVLRQPAVNNASERQRSRSPHGDNRSRQWTTSQNARLSRVLSR